MNSGISCMATSRVPDLISLCCFFLFGFGTYRCLARFALAPDFLIFLDINSSELRGQFSTFRCALGVSFSPETSDGS
jgi:hypothetical protein